MLCSAKQYNTSQCMFNQYHCSLRILNPLRCGNLTVMYKSYPNWEVALNLGGWGSIPGIPSHKPTVQTVNLGEDRMTDPHQGHRLLA